MMGVGTGKSFELGLKGEIQKPYKWDKFHYRFYQ